MRDDLGYARALEALPGFSDEMDRWSGENLTESDTRAKLIDSLFKDVLQWDESGIRRESRTADGEYLDYIFISGNNRFVVEAKRAGIAFRLPARPTPYRTRRQDLVATHPDLAKALEQVVSYCLTQSCPVGVATNGTQYAVTLAQHASLSEYDTLLFGGFSALRFDFGLLWQMLSAEGQAASALLGKLASQTTIRPAPQFSQRLGSQLAMPDQFVQRNSLDATLAPVLSKYFTELTNSGREDLLRKAYVVPTAQSRYARQIDDLFKDVMPTVRQPVQELHPQEGEPTPLDAAVYQHVARRQDTFDGVVYLLIGGVGAGKTTFANHYFAYLAPVQVRQSVLAIRLDFTEMPEGATKIGEWVDGEVIKSIQAQSMVDVSSWASLKEVYHDEVTTLENGVLAPWLEDPVHLEQKLSDELRALISQTQQHVRKVIQFLRERRNLTVCVIFDNVDQLGQEPQQSIITTVHQKARTWKILAILSLREETYWRYQSVPPLDAYHRHTYHITSPPFARVLEKRLAVAKEAHGSEIVSIQSRLGVTVSGVSLAEFLKIVIDSFLGHETTNVELISHLSSGDTRKALDMFRSFLTSGHTNIDEYLAMYMTNKRYIVPFHHVFRGIAFGERRYYDSTRSLVDNMFSIHDDGFYSHFQKIRLLKYLLGVRHVESTPGRGFISVPQLFQAFRALVMDEEGLRRILDSLLQHRLVEAANGYRVTGPEADAVRITSAGAYYLGTLLNEFAYLDLCAMDTPILSAERFGRITGKDVSPQGVDQSIPARARRVTEFVDYLIEQEDAELRHVAAAGLPEGAGDPVAQQIKAQVVDRQLPGILGRSSGRGGA